MRVINLKQGVVALFALVSLVLTGCAVPVTVPTIPGVPQTLDLAVTDVSTLACETYDYAKFRDVVAELAEPTVPSGKWAELKTRFNLDVATTDGRMKTNEVINRLGERATACANPAPVTSATPSPATTATSTSTATPTAGVSASPVPVYRMPELRRVVEAPDVRNADRDQRLLDLVATCGNEPQRESWMAVADGRDKSDALWKGDGKLMADYATVKCAFMSNPDVLYQFLRAVQNYVVTDMENIWIENFLAKSETGWDPNSTDATVRAGKLNEQWTTLENSRFVVTHEYQLYAQAGLELLDYGHAYVGVRNNLTPANRMSADNYGLVERTLPLSYDSNNPTSGEFVLFASMAVDGTFYGVGFDTKDGNVSVFTPECVCEQAPVPECAAPAPAPTTRAPAPKPRPTTTRPAPAPAPTTRAPAPKPRPTTTRPAPAPAPTTRAPEPQPTTLPPKPSAQPAPREEPRPQPTTTAPPEERP